jgi:hypothetical protein
MFLASGVIVGAVVLAVSARQPAAPVQVHQSYELVTCDDGVPIVSDRYQYAALAEHENNKGVYDDPHATAVAKAKEVFKGFEQVREGPVPSVQLVIDDSDVIGVVDVMTETDGRYRAKGMSGCASELMPE